MYGPARHGKRRSHAISCSNFLLHGLYLTVFCLKTLLAVAPTVDKGYLVLAKPPLSYKFIPPCLSVTLYLGERACTTAVGIPLYVNGSGFRQLPVAYDEPAFAASPAWAAAFWELLKSAWKAACNGRLVDAFLDVDVTDVSMISTYSAQRNSPHMQP